MALAGSTSLAAPNPDKPLTFWTRESRHIKQALKTGVAGLITYAIYIHFHLPEGYWAVFTALMVTQANLGVSWKAALYRTAGSTVGALAAGILMPLVGTGVVRTGIVLFVVATLFAFLTTLHPSFSAAGFTAALVLLLSSHSEPFHLAWLPSALHDRGRDRGVPGGNFAVAGTCARWLTNVDCEIPGAGGKAVRGDDESSESGQMLRH